VGDAASFDVVATLTNGATGPLTITVDALPDGLSLGSTSQVDATNYKATVSGTYTTVETGTSTYGATGGSVAATPLVHAFNVAASGTATPSLVQSTVHNDNANSLSLSFVNDTAASNLLVAVVTIPNNHTITAPPAGFDFFGSFLGGPDFYLYEKISTGVEGSVDVTQSSASQCAIALYEWKDASGLAGLSGSDLASMAAGVHDVTLGPTTSPPDANAIPVASYALTGTQDTPIHGDGWTADIPGKNSYSPATAHMATPPGVAVSDVVTVSVPGLRGGTGVTYWVKP
jgi:hypothetical protein